MNINEYGGADDRGQGDPRNRGRYGPDNSSLDGLRNEPNLGLNG